MNKNVITTVGGLIIAGVFFYVGMYYQKSKMPEIGSGVNGGSRSGLQGIGGGARNNVGGFTAGEIISKDASSVTIKMQDGSTKIVLVSDSTQVTKNTNGTLGDLTTGVNISVTGTINSDGSVTAKSLQIRPAGSAGNFGGGNRAAENRTTGQ